MQEQTSEQRRTPRYRARVRVLYFSKGRPRAVDAQCQNISNDGLFVQTRRRGPEAGTPVSLLLNFEGASRELMVEGVVRWQGGIRSLEDGTEAAGMGIQFTQMEPEVRRAIEKSLADLGTEV